MRSEKVILEERAKIIAQVKDRWAGVREEKRSPNDDENAFFDKADVDVAALTDELAEVRKSVTLETRMATYDSMLDEKIAEQRSVLPQGARDNPKEFRNTLKKWMLYGKDSLTTEERSLLGAETRGTSTQVSSTANLGGYAMPEDWANDLYKSMLYFGGALEACGIKFRTSGGGDFHYPTANDTANKATIIGQGTGDTVKDVTLAEKVWKAWSYTTGLIKWSWETFDDLGFDVVSETRDILAERMARGLNYDFTLGTDTTMPLGLVPGSTLGKAAAGASAITRNEIVDLIHAVDRAHRNAPQTAFMFNDSTLSYIKKLAFGSSDDRPLWQPSIREGEPDRLEGFKYYVNNDMGSIATGVKTILFGNFGKYGIRQTGSYILARSDERYFEERAVAFSLFARFDGRYLDTAAVKHLIQA